MKENWEEKSNEEGSNIKENPQERNEKKAWRIYLFHQNVFWYHKRESEICSFTLTDTKKDYSKPEKFIEKCFFSQQS